MEIRHRIKRPSALAVLFFVAFAISLITTAAHYMSYVCPRYFSSRQQRAGTGTARNAFPWEKKEESGWRDITQGRSKLWQNVFDANRGYAGPKTPYPVDEKQVSSKPWLPMFGPSQTRVDNDGEGIGSLFNTVPRNSDEAWDQFRLAKVAVTESNAQVSAGVGAAVGSVVTMGATFSANPVTGIFSGLFAALGAACIYSSVAEAPGVALAVLFISGCGIFALGARANEDTNLAQMKGVLAGSLASVTTVTAVAFAFKYPLIAFMTAATTVPVLVLGGLLYALYGDYENFFKKKPDYNSGGKFF